MRETSAAFVPVEPLCQVAQEYRHLVERPYPLTLVVGDLGEGLPENPLDMVTLRSLLLHPAVAFPVRGRIWARLLNLAGDTGTQRDEWRIAVTGLAWPGLWPMYLRLRRQLAVQDWEDLQQHLLEGFWAALVRTGTDPSWQLLEPGRLPSRLLWAADRAGRAFRDQRATEQRELCCEDAETMDDARVAESRSPGEERGPDVLEHAVALGVLDAQAAELLARSRVDGVPMRVLAVEYRVTPEALGMRRKRAEKRLADAVRAGLLDTEGRALSLMCR